MEDGVNWKNTVDQPRARIRRATGSNLLRAVVLPALAPVGGYRLAPGVHIRNDQAPGGRGSRRAGPWTGGERLSLNDGLPSRGRRGGPSQVGSAGASPSQLLAAPSEHGAGPERISEKTSAAASRPIRLSCRRLGQVPTL